jgi:predicted phosphodiesterase
MSSQILLFADSHIHANDDLERFVLLNKYIKRTKIKRVVCVGDFLSLDSCSAHASSGSLEDKKKPRLADEITKGFEAGRRLTKGLNDDVWFDMVMGNHEDRLSRFVNLHPAECNADGHALASLLRYDTHWDHVTDYREYLKLTNSLAVTHIPHNIMGRPIGGVNAARLAGTHLGCDLVFGHTHQFNVTTIPLFDGTKRTVVTMPCFMQAGYIPSYARNISRGWSNGIVTLSLKEQCIDSVSMLSLTDLQESV